MINENASNIINRPTIFPVINIYLLTTVLSILSIIFHQGFPKKKGGYLPCHLHLLTTVLSILSIIFHQGFPKKKKNLPHHLLFSSITMSSSTIVPTPTNFLLISFLFPVLYWLKAVYYIKRTSMEARCSQSRAQKSTQIGIFLVLSCFFLIWRTNT